VLSHRLFSEGHQADIAHFLYSHMQAFPLICPHGHVPPHIFAQPDYHFGSPVDLLILPDHYIYRMLYSQGIALEALGLDPGDGSPVETDHTRIWQTFAEHFYLFRGTPTRLWLEHSLSQLFGIDEKLDAHNAQAIYQTIAASLQQPEYTPRALYDSFGIEALCTTDFATDTLEHHQAISMSGWNRRVLPTFRPDDVVNMDRPDWRRRIDLLADLTGIDIVDYATYLRAVEMRRHYFRLMGAVATDHAALSADTTSLTLAEADAVVQRGLRQALEPNDAARFTAHMLGEMARMSCEDGLVMQLHCGSLRDHNPALAARFGPDRGADIPISAEFTRSLRPLLARYGSHPRLRLIVFTLDESAYSRELAPLAGHYPALRLGPPWWFHDSVNGITRWLEQVVETAGIYNTVGFNDDTRSLPSIPARHDTWRRVCANWLAGLVVRSIIDQSDAEDMAAELAYGLAKESYRL
jgi:glucuronate isomerase